MSKKRKGKGKKSKDQQAEALQRWTEDHGNLTGKSFAKKLPKEAAEIRNGRTDKEALARRLAAKAFEGQNMMKLQFRAMAKYTIPLDGTEDLRSKFEDTMERLKVYRTPDEAEKLSDADVMEENQSCFKRACDEHMEEIVDRCFQGDKDAFLEQCELYSASQERYLFLNNQLIEKTPDWKDSITTFTSFQSHMNVALRQVERGIDNSKNKCWECDVMLQKVLKCGKCDAARYCGRDCQVKAWKGGHKNSFPWVKQAYENFTNNIKIVDAAHSDPVAHKKRYGIGPSPQDYTIAGFNCVVLVFRPMVAFMYPEMDMFYKNLELVRSQRLWPVPGSHISGSSQGEGHGRVATAAVKKMDWTGDLCEEFGQIASALAFNYSADKDPSLACRGVLLSKMEDPTKAKHSMSPTRFLHIYSNPLPGTNGYSPKSWRLEAFHIAHHNMRNTLHKWSDNTTSQQQSSMQGGGHTFQYNECHRTEVHNHFFR